MRRGASVTVGSESERVLNVERPWLGLVSFTEPAREYFFGRSAETDELLRRVRRDRATLLFGLSGLGKTSLLQAGLFPRLRAQAFVPALVRLDFSAGTLALAEQVKELIRQALLSAEIEGPDIGPDETLWEVFHRAGPEFRDRLGRPVTIVIVFDQFEEVFTLGLGRPESRVEAQAFLSELADLIEDRPPVSIERRLEDDPDFVDSVSFDRDAYRVVVTLREDYLPSLDALRSRAPSLGESRFRLLRMSGEQALEAVLRPGRDLVSRDVATDIVRFVGRNRIDSPFGDKVGAGGLAELDVDPALLSLICRELNERRIADGAPQVTAALLAGSRDDILRGFYESAFEGLPENLRDFVEDELITESGVRESMAVERAERALAVLGVPSGDLATLVGRRLLHVEERLDMPRVEIVHDVLASVIVRSRGERRQRRALAQNAALSAAAARRTRHRVMRIAALTAACLVVSAAGFWVFAFKQNEARMEQQVAVVDRYAAGAIRKVISVDQVRVIDCPSVLPLVGDTSLIEGLTENDPDNPRYAGAAAVLVAIRTRCTTRQSDDVKALTKRLNDEKIDRGQASLTPAETAAILKDVISGLQRKVRAYIAVVDRHPDDVNPEHLYWALYHLGRSVQDSGENDATIELYERALSILVATPGMDQVVRRQIDTELNLTEVFSSQQRYPDMDQASQTMLGLIDRLPGADAPDLATKAEFRAIVYDFLGRSKVRRRQAAVTANDPEGAKREGAASVEDYEKALAASLDAQKALPEKIWTEQLVSSSNQKLGETLAWLGLTERAEAAYVREVASRRELLFRDLYEALNRSYAGDTQYRIDLLTAIRRLASLQLSRGELAGVTISLDRCVREGAILVDRDNRPASRQALGLCRIDLAEFQGSRRKTVKDFEGATTTAAQTYLSAADDLIRASDDPALTDAPSKAASALRSALLLWEEIERLPDAMAASDRRVDFVRKIYRRQPSDDNLKARLAGALQSRAWIALLSGRTADAEAASREAVGLAPTDLWILSNLAHTLMLEGRFAEAQPLYRRILDSKDEQLLAAVRQDFLDLAKHGAMAPDFEAAKAMFA